MVYKVLIFTSLINRGIKNYNKRRQNWSDSQDKLEAKRNSTFVNLHPDNAITFHALVTSDIMLVLNLLTRVDHPINFVRYVQFTFYTIHPNTQYLFIPCQKSHKP